MKVMQIMEPPTKLHHASLRRSHVSLKHVVESQQFTVPLLMELFDRSRLMERIVARGGTLDYQSKILASLFYKPSTRTRFCFEAAMLRLGGRVLSTEHAQAFSSEVEGEQVGGGSLLECHRNGRHTVLAGDLAGT